MSLISKGLIVLFICVNSQAEEVDNFSIPSPAPRSATNAVNALIEEAMASFVLRMNSNPTRVQCDRDKLMQSAVYYFDENFSKIGNTLRDLSSEAKEENRFIVQPITTSSLVGSNVNERKLRLKLDKSILFRISEIKKEKAIPSKSIDEIQFWGPTSRNDSPTYRYLDIHACCAKSLNIDGTYLGLDKIDHFFGNGGILWESYNDMGEKKSNYPKIAQMAVNQENGGWGLAGSKVKSYGDIAANWQGFKFYDTLFDDYFTCQDGKISRTKRKFNMADYVDDLWDESINCSAFESKENLAKFQQNLASQKTSCPRVPQKCTDLVKKYQNDPIVLKITMSPVCNGTKKMSEALEKPNFGFWKDLKNFAGGVRAQDLLKIIGFGGTN
jgi:hypothetical protein